MVLDTFTYTEGNIPRGLGNQGLRTVEAVIGEPVSVSGIRCFAGKYREILPLKAGAGDAAPHYRTNSERFLQIPQESKQGISRTEQGLP